MDSSRRERAGGVEWTQPRGAKGGSADPRTAVWRMDSFGAAERGIHVKAQTLLLQLPKPLLL